MDLENLREFTNLFCAALAVCLALQMIPPSGESDTFYHFVDNTQLNGDGQALSRLGYANQYNGSYYVYIDANLPQIIKTIAIRHENCHVRQFKNKINATYDEREVECYLGMWLP
jgi:hypothetical protein